MAVDPQGNQPDPSARQPVEEQPELPVNDALEPAKPDSTFAEQTAEQVVEVPAGAAQDPVGKGAPPRRTKSGDWQSSTARKRGSSVSRDAKPKLPEAKPEPADEPAAAAAVVSPTARRPKTSSWGSTSARKRGSSAAREATPKATEESPQAEPEASTPRLQEVSEVDPAARRKKSSNWADSSSRRKR